MIFKRVILGKNRIPGAVMQGYGTRPNQVIQGNADDNSRLRNDTMQLSKGSLDSQKASQAEIAFLQPFPRITHQLHTLAKRP